MQLSRIMNPPEDEGEPRPSLRTFESNPPQGPAPRPSPGAGTLGADEKDQEEIPVVSFIVCMEAKEEGKVTYVSPTAYDLLGWDPDYVVGTPASLYCHPDDVADLYRAYQEMIDEDKAACLMYHRIPYNDPSKGHILCSVTISRAGTHLIGACSPATESAKAIHNASTASEVIIVTPSAARLAFTRWNLPSPPAPAKASTSSEGTSSSREGTPSSPSDIHSSPSPESSPRNETDELTQSFNHLTLRPPPRAEIAKRVAFVLDRFSKDVHVIYCTNDEILPRSLCMGRPFYDFIAPVDEKRVRRAIDSVKAWGVNERGSPADGGFAFNRFHMYLRGWDSSQAETGTLRKSRSAHAMTPGAPIKSSHAKQRLTSERGINVPAKDILLVDSILSPQSDGIIVIIRPALPTT